MRQLMLTVTGLMAMCFGLSAATVCTTTPTLVHDPNDVEFTFSQWSTAGFQCTQTTKIYSNFSPSAGMANVSLELVDTGVTHRVVFGGDLTNAFTVSYVVTVCCGGSPITRVSGDISNPDVFGNPSVTKSFTGGATGSITFSTLGGGAAITIPGSMTLNVTDVYSPGGGAAQSFGNAFTQTTTVPEPATTALFGAGLLALGMVARRRRAKS